MNLDQQHHNLPSTTVASERGFSLGSIISGWLDETAKSPKTRKAYETNIIGFREFVQVAGKDLLYQSPEMDVEIADLAQVWMSRARANGKVLSPATKQQRLATLSSFYDYAIRRRHIRHANPVTLMKRPKVEAYAASQAISPEQLRERLAAIDCTSKQGKQDLALLLVALSTGRRATELSSLRRKHLSEINDRVLMHFEHTKGDKQIDDLLEPEISEVLETWLTEAHGGLFWRSDGDTPIWIDCYHESRYGEPLGYHGIANVCQRRLGTSKVHTLRGTFAILMEQAGAKITDIQQRLQHDNAATTGIYLNKLKRSQNVYSGRLVKVLGLRAENGVDER